VTAVDEIRAHFPALQRVYNGHPVAYFDAPGGTQTPRQVADAITRYLFDHNANTHWSYPSSEETDAVIAGARTAAAELLNAQDNEIVFGANMTTLTFHLARALGRTWREGDEVIVTELDHHGNIDPWRALEVERGIVVRSARMIAETAQVDLDHLASLVSSRTRLVAIGAASNAVGTINDLARVGAVARAAGALLFVDAVHLVPHALLDVQALGCDFLACSAYKFYGPHAGILFARSELLESLPFPKVEPAGDTGPERAETGTQNHEAIAGIAATIDFLASLATEDGTRRERLTRVFASLHDEGMRLTRMLWDGLSSMDGVRLYGPPPSFPRTPTIACTIRDTASEEVSRALAKRGIFASHGDFYAATAVERLGVAREGLLRIGCACYTTKEEVERLLKEVEGIVTSS
jgi:cysteine desulfurase family protein (TIGR01976 family)